ncbi:MAG: ComEC/Rec2 family competence protein [Bacteroidota bacterium]
MITLKTIFTFFYACFLTFFIPGIASAQLTLTAIDIGQGDAVLVQHESYAILIDGGRPNDLVADYLKDQDVSQINLMIATHAHADHVGGLIGVLNKKEVDQVWYNGQTHTTLTFERFIDAVLESEAKYHEPSRGEMISFGEMDIQVLHPEDSAADYEGHLHDKNIVIRIVYGDFAAIISGDIERNGELEILASGIDVSAQVLELGHHGSRTSSHPEWLKAVAPELAFWQSGDGNRYGYPHQEIFVDLDYLGISAIGTDTHGTIRIIADKDGTFSVETERQSDVTISVNRSSLTLQSYALRLSFNQ